MNHIDPLPPLHCPVDGDALTPRGDHLECPAGHRYPVLAGIPRVVQSLSSYADAFGDQWNTYRATQLDSYTKAPITHDRLVRCLGPELWARLGGTEPVSVLETGCGAGRFTEVLLAQPAAHVTSTDLSSAVEANQSNCPQSPRHRVVQCDIMQLPFRPQSFDVVICLGVVQHTPDPEETISRLYAQVKPGGWLVIDHYAPSLAQYTKITAILLRPLLKRLPPRAGSRATEMLTDIFFPLHRVLRRHRTLQMMYSRLSPLLTYYQTYPQLDDRLQYEWALLDTHDHLTDYYKHLRNDRQIAATLAGLGGRDIWTNRGGNGVEARCRRPEAT
jgi:2-polyprenyl-3-methyl-5-hydroxy-6-metoxy-1,4-benzoquinol methylase